ncbi:hypothetical protein TNCV_2166861 [Trichonephila clavipes]|nr:hypothetical protein TNCV_2166861 [Trichonephila clavipes]
MDLQWNQYLNPCHDLVLNGRQNALDCNQSGRLDVISRMQLRQACHEFPPSREDWGQDEERGKITNALTFPFSIKWKDQPDTTGCPIGRSINNSIDELKSPFLC